MIVTRYIIKRNGTPAAPGAKLVAKGTVRGDKTTYKFPKQGHPVIPVGVDRVLTETGDFLNTETSDRITTG